MSETKNHIGAARAKSERKKTCIPFLKLLSRMSAASPSDTGI